MEVAIHEHQKTNKIVLRSLKSVILPTGGNFGHVLQSKPGSRRIECQNCDASAFKGRPGMATVINAGDEDCPDFIADYKKFLVANVVDNRFEDLPEWAEGLRSLVEDDPLNQATVEGR